jgi:hypothetical protein
VGKSNETLEQEIEQLRNELDQLKQEKRHEYADSESANEEVRDIQDRAKEVADDAGTSRRTFLKAAGLSVAGLGAAALGSSLEINSNYPFKYSNKSASTPNFKIDTQGNVDLNGNDISNVGSLNTEQLSSTTTDTEELSTTRADVTSQLGNIHPSDRITFSPQYQGSIFSGTDPIIIHHSHFDDDEYRFVISDGGWVLRKTPNFESGSYTTIDTDIRPTTDTGDLQDHIVLPDGTFVVYDGRGSPSETYAYTGQSLTNLSTKGRVIDGYTDCGAFYNEDDGTIHLYTEGDSTTVASSPIVRHYTTPDDDLLTSTRQADALDLSSKNWKTGDAGVLQLGEYYYMFLDHHYPSSGSNYRIALARSPDLFEWTVVSENFTGRVAGGDMRAAKAKDGITYHALTEFSQGGGVGLWRLWVTPSVGDIQAPGETITVNSGKDGTLIAEIEASVGRNSIYLHEHPESQGFTQGYRIVDKDGDEVMRLDQNGIASPNSSARVLGPNGNSIGVSGGKIKASIGGTNTFEWLDDGGVRSEAQDLSNTQSFDSSIHRHDGSASITLADGTTTSNRGYYVWDGNADPDSDGTAEGAWRAITQLT